MLACTFLDAKKAEQSVERIPFTRSSYVDISVRQLRESIDFRYEIRRVLVLNHIYHGPAVSSFSLHTRTHARLRARFRRETRGMHRRSIFSDPTISRFSRVQIEQTPVSPVSANPSSEILNAE